MRRLRLIPALGLLVGAGFLLSACGGDDSPEQTIVIPTETQAETASRDEFIADADPICGEANAAIEQFAAAGEGITAADEIAQLRQGVITDLQELGPPEEDRATLDDFLAGMENQVEAGEKIALALARGSDTAEFEAELDAAQAETLAAGEAYGFEVCGQEPDASGTGSVAPGVPGDPTAPAPVAPAPVAPDTSDDAGGDAGGTGDDTGGDTGGSGGGVSPGGVGPG